MQVKHARRSILSGQQHNSRCRQQKRTCAPVERVGLMHEVRVSKPDVAKTDLNFHLQTQVNAGGPTQSLPALRSLRYLIRTVEEAPQVDRAGPPHQPCSDTLGTPWRKLCLTPRSVTYLVQTFRGLALSKVERWSSRWLTKRALDPSHLCTLVSDLSSNLFPRDSTQPDAAVAKRSKSAG